MLIFKTMIVNDCVNKKKMTTFFYADFLLKMTIKKKKIKNYFQQIVITFQRRRF